MADNIDVTPGTGKTIAADDVSGVLYQRVKLAVGADGTALDVSTTSPLPVDQITGAFTSVRSFTRPADTTAYAANDVVGGVHTFAFAGPAGGSIIINTATLEIDITTAPSGMNLFRLYLYSATPPSALADNAPFDLPAGDRAAFLGYIDFDSLVDLGSTLFTQKDLVGKQLKLASTTLYGYLVTLGAFTPGNADPYKLTINNASL